MENIGIFYGNLEYFTTIRYILRPFGKVVLIWYISPRFGILCQEISGNPQNAQNRVHHLISRTPKPVPKDRS
jgi:hypothetical protein